MLADQPTQLTLEISSSEPIAGSLRRAEDEPRPFRGWIELTAMIVAAVEEPDAPPPERP